MLFYQYLCFRTICGRLRARTQEFRTVDQVLPQLHGPRDKARRRECYPRRVQIGGLERVVEATVCDGGNKTKKGEKFSDKVEKYIRANHPLTLDSRGPFNYELILSIVGQKIGDRTFCINNVHL